MHTEINNRLYDKIKSLAGISEAGTLHILDIAERTGVPKGEFLLEQEKVCKQLFFVEEGFLRIFTDDDGTDINTGFVFEDNFTTGLKSILTGTHSDVSIQALENSVVWLFDYHELQELSIASTEIATFVQRIMENIFEQGAEHEKIYHLHAPKERYDWLLEHHPQIIQRVNQTHLASYLGIARETLNRIRKK